MSIKDQLLVGRTLLDIGAAVDTGNSTSKPMGTSPYIFNPSATSGNYFQALSQKSRRLQLVANMTTGALNWLGTHTLSAGGNAAGLDLSQQASRTEIDYLRTDGTLSEVATFSGPSAFRLANTQIGGYAQDVWRPLKPIVFSAGVRTDWDRLIHQDVPICRAADCDELVECPLTMDE